MELIKKISKIPEKESIVFLLKDVKNLKSTLVTRDEMKYIKEQKEKHEKDLILLNRLDHYVFIYFIKKEDNRSKRLENCRIAGDRITAMLNDHKVDRVTVHDLENLKEEVMALAEGMALGNYQFLKYFKEEEKKKKKNSLETIQLVSRMVSREDAEILNVIIESTYFSRDLVNEPLSTLTAVALAREIEKKATEAGAKVEIMNKKKIEALKMGGLLAVNKGSIDPPTFTVFEWKPPNPINDKPYIFVGKGVVFDTGGINLKPGNYIDTMKCDMSGAAAVSAAVYAIAKAKLPVHVIALVPATDNRPDGNAYVPGDVIKMYDGTFVEVLNTDAEGRMILADALSYAKKYDPELVIDVATLTGSAAIALGKFGVVAMKAKSDEEFETLKKSGENVYERIVEFPFWDEFKELLKSEVADLKNIGGRDAGAITAGKFLEHFTDYPFIHLDIAGPAFLDKRDSYRGSGGSGVTVRLLFDFIYQKCLV